MDRAQRAREILSSIEYITIATASKNAQPWNSPVLGAYDEHYNFYWTSMEDTQHSRNIRENPSVYIVIFDSTVPHGEGGGVYVKATAKELSDPSEIASAAAFIYKRKNKPARATEEFMGESPRRLYKAVPEKVWITLGEDVKNDPLNPKKEISLV